MKQPTIFDTYLKYTDDYKHLVRKYGARQEVKNLIKFLKEYCKLATYGKEYSNDKVDALFKWSNKIFIHGSNRVQTIFIGRADKYILTRNLRVIKKLNEEFSTANYSENKRQSQVIAIDNLVAYTHLGCPLIPFGFELDKYVKMYDWSYHFMMMCFDELKVKSKGR